MSERDLEVIAQEPEYVALTNDLLFHMVFTMNELALKSLLSSLLSMPEEQIQKIEILNPMQYNESFDTKLTVMDLKAIDEAEEHEKENGLVDWAEAFTAKDWKAVEKIDNPGVKEAQKTMEVIMSEPTQRQLIIDRRTALLDRQAELDDATRKGRAEGRAEGRVEILADLVKDGLLSAGEAAKRLNMTEREFVKAAGLYLAQ